jgi:hypothetical protein
MTGRVLLLLTVMVVMPDLGCASGSPDAPAAAPPAGGSLTAAPPVSGKPAVPAPGAARAAVCEKIRPGPSTAPAKAVRVSPAVAGDLSAKSSAKPAGTTYWLAPGVHKLERTEFAQVQPETGDTFLGAPGAVLDGAGVNRYAFTGKAANVTIRNLTVRGFVPPPNEGVVNHDSGAGWLIEDNTLIDNRGAAMMAGPGQIMRGNCLKDNGQYGLNGCCGTVRDIVLERNEFVGNNADDLEKKQPGCGCAGAMKLWAVDGADIRGNWIHDNRGPGIWADTDNNDFLIEHNLIEDNDGPAIFYETSYNAIIRDNVIRRNNLVDGREFVDRRDSFPSAAIYVSEAGGEPRVRARTDKIDIYRNVLVDNWSGVTLWENADRFCNSAANTSTGTCTRLVGEVSRCRQPGIASPPLFADCRWKTQRVEIHDNRFAVRPADIGCTSGCARMAVISNVGTFPNWSPYKGDGVQKAITFDQQNRWYRNTYAGPWTFTPFDTSRVLGLPQWQSPPYRQDAGSKFS